MRETLFFLFSALPADRRHHHHQCFPLLLATTTFCRGAEHLPTLIFQAPFKGGAVLGRGGDYSASGNVVRLFGPISK